MLSGCASRKAPNILFALADDQSYPHAGALGDPLVRTPAFDRVAAEGALFTHSFCACPSCTPSRSAILTGRHIWEVGEAGVLYGTLPPEQPLFTHGLERAGYELGWTGKGWAPGDWAAAGLESNPLGAEFNRIKVPAPPATGLDERDYAANFAAFLAARSPDKPFFFWYGCTEPHRVYEDGYGRRLGKDPAAVEIPAYWPDDPVVRGDVLDYYGEVEWFDRHLAQMMRELERLGELDNTLVVVTSDNGMPFPRAKVNLYDPGVRMPLAMRWPERIRAGTVIDDFVSHTDFAATFLEAAGAPAQQTTGSGLLPLLDGNREPDRDCVLTGLERHTWCRPEGATYPMRAIRTADYLYIRNFEPDRWPTGGPDFISSNKEPHGDVDACPTKTFLLDNAERYPREYALGFGKRPAEELYHLASDAAQVRNVAGDAAHATAQQELWRRLEAELTRTADPRIRGEDPWQGHVYRQTIGFGATFNRSLPLADREAAAGRGAHKPE